MNTVSLVVVMAVMVVVSTAYAAEEREQLVGSYKPIKNLDDPIVVEMAKFAVNQHNKEAGTNLHYVKIVKGDQQVVSGMNYRLVISATDANAIHNYLAIVYDAPWKHIRTLISFNSI